MPRQYTPKVECHCSGCGKVLLKSPSVAALYKENFCSKSCRFPKKVECDCERCGKKFLTVPSRITNGRGHFCSRDCAYPLRNTSREERFFLFVGKKQENGCILWCGLIEKNGYGRLVAGEYKTGRGIWAHRLAYEVLVGPIPEGMEVCHNCPGGDNPPCINPVHLFLGTHAENMADMSKKGRAATGTRSASSKLTDELVREIRKLYDTGEFTQEELGCRFGVGGPTIHNVANRQTWKHVQ